MKILHLCLACYYVDGYNYQENNLPRINAEDGHEVQIIASTATFVDNNRIGFTRPGEYLTEYGVPLIRLAYRGTKGGFLSNRIRCYRGLYARIMQFSPDVIMAHGLSFWSLSDVVRYCKSHPGVKFYADTHTDYYTSGTNWLSMNLLHRIYYRNIIQKAIPYLDKLFYITDECKIFSLREYKIPESLMEFYPLGGDCLADEEYNALREKTRKRYGVADGLLFVHAGKIEPMKKTEQLIRAFSNVPGLNAKLVVAGSIDPGMQESIEELIRRDERIVYAGWKSAEELTKLLCGADLYCQPGKVSAIMQNAVCCRCPVMVYPYLCYLDGYNYGNEIFVENEQEVEETFDKISSGQLSLKEYREQSVRCARELLDYHSLAARLYR